MHTSTARMHGQEQKTRCFASEEEATHHPQRVAAEQLAVCEGKRYLNQLLSLSS